MRLKKKRFEKFHPATRIWNGYYCPSAIFVDYFYICRKSFQEVKIRSICLRKYSVARKLMQVILINMAHANTWHDFALASYTFFFERSNFRRPFVLFVRKIDDYLSNGSSILYTKDAV